jgi:hypothetical protein
VAQGVAFGHGAVTFESATNTVTGGPAVCTVWAFGGDYSVASSSHAMIMTENEILGVAEGGFGNFAAWVVGVFNLNPFSYGSSATHFWIIRINNLRFAIPMTEYDGTYDPSWQAILGGVFTYLVNQGLNAGFAASGLPVSLPFIPFNTFF